MRTIAAIGLALSSPFAVAQTAGSGQEKAGGVQAPRSFEGAFGYARNYAGGDPSAIYYKLTYLGTPLFERGEAPRLARVGSTFLTDPSEVDGYDLKFLVNDGVGELTGPLADLIALRPIRVRGGLFKYFRGKIQTTAKLLDAQQYNLGVGLESINLVPDIPGLSGWLRPPSGIRDALQTGDPAKVLRVGVLGEKQSRERGSDSAKATDTLQFTYRAYFAAGFRYVATESVEAQRRLLLKRIEGLSQDDLAVLRRDRPVSDPIVLMLVDSLIDAPDLKDRPLEEQRAYLVKKLPAGLRQQPTFNLEARAEGSYNPLDYDVRRYNSLYTVGINVWLSPTHPDDGKLFVGYQNGYSRGALTQSLDSFVASLSFRLR